MENKQEKKATLCCEDAVQLIKDYFNETVIDEHGRYLSWRHCYKAFGENRNKMDDPTIDYLCLHLAFYLASWGMLRGSSFLLQKDYKVHTPIVRMIQEERYNPLFGISARDLCKEENLLLLEEIGNRIKEAYAKELPAKEGVINNATETLITKILLGTLGCVPAYDRYYIDAVKKHKVSSGQYNSTSIKGVATYYCDHEEEFEALRMELSKCGVEYPAMKLMDMCFWQSAYIEEITNKKD